MKKTLALILTFIMVLALVPSVAFAAGNTIYVDATNGDDTTGDGTGANPYKTVGKAAEKAVSGDTIMLGEGEYTLYNISSDNTTKSKDLTFIGKGADKTVWNIGTGIVDQRGQGNGDFSFKDSGTIEFQNMTLKAAVISETGEQVDWDYTGFAHTTNTIVKNCTVNGKTFYWGYTSAIFKNTTFYCPAGDYAVWTYSSPTMSFESCTFNSTGKVINVYTDYSAGKHNITVNFKNCTVNNTGESLKPVLNINDSNMGDFKYILNITGDNKVSGVDVDKATCSRLFGFGGKADTNNKCKTVVNINKVKVWENGERVCPHNGFVFGEGSYNGDKTTQYTDGYKDNAFTVTPKPNVPGSFEVKCIHCGYTEISTGELSNEIKLTRTVRQNKNSNPVPEDAPNSNKYKVANSSGITVDYTATMDMTKLEWKVAGKDVKKIQEELGFEAKSPWELLMALAQQIDDRTEVILTFKFDDKIDLKAFKAKYEAAVNAGKPTDVLMLTSDMFEMTDVDFDTNNTMTNNTMTITCKWKEEANTEDTIITLKGCGLPVVKDNWGGNKIDITNSGCVSGMVHIKYKKPGSDAKMMVEPGSNVAAEVQVQNTYPPVDNTIQIPIVGGCAADKFTLYYGGGSSGDSGGSSSGGGYYHPTTTPVPVIVIPPKTGDMTVWQSILHFLGIK